MAGAKKARVKRSGAVKNRVNKKRASTKQEPVAPANPSRRGRPPSVDVLQRKLARVSESLARKRQVNSELREKIAADAQLKRKLKSELNTLKAELDGIKSAQERARQGELERRRMQEAQDAAVEKFVSQWQKKYLARTAASKAVRRKGRKRGRPKTS
jgi:hypothetical protein